MQENSITTASRFLSQIRKKNVVYITVKNKDYIRTSQIRHILEENSAFFRIYSSEKSNPVSRALDLRCRISSMDIRKADVVIIGFLPQLLLKAVKKKIDGNDACYRNGAANGDGSDACHKTFLVAEMFLSLYDTVISDRHLFADGGVLSNLLKRLDKMTIEAADLVVTDTKANADYLSRLYDAGRDKFETLYLEADKEIYGATYSSSSLNVLYFGSGLPLQGTDIILEAFSIVAGQVGNCTENKSSGTNNGFENADYAYASADSGIEDHSPRYITCTYVGSTKEIPGKILDKARSNPYIEIIPWLPQNLLAKKIAQADLCIAGHFNPNIGKADRTIPGKAYIYEAMNKKMILGDTTANHEIFVEDNRHFFVKRGDPQKLADAIAEFIKDNSDNNQEISQADARL